VTPFITDAHTAMRPTLFHPRHEQRHHLFSVPEALHRNVVSTATPVTGVNCHSGHCGANCHSGHCGVNCYSGHCYRTVVASVTKGLVLNGSDIFAILIQSNDFIV